MLVEIGLDYMRSLVRDLEGLCRLLEHQKSGSGRACLPLHVFTKVAEERGKALKIAYADTSAKADLMLMLSLKCRRAVFSTALSPQQLHSRPTVSPCGAHLLCQSVPT